MFTTVLATALLASASPCPATTSPAPSLLAEDSEVDQKIAAAGEDVDKLLALATEYKEASDRASAKKVYQRIIEIDPDQKDARKGLRHQFYDGKWFTSYVELSKYKREEAVRMKEQGLAKWKDEWVPEADLPYLQLGWEKNEQGEWGHPADLARAKQVAEWQSEGYRYRADDNSWVAPDEVKLWEEGKMKCGDEWLEFAEAEKFHSNLMTAWELAGEHFIIHTPHSWAMGNEARTIAESAYPDLVRLYGAEPESKPYVAVLRSLDEYNAAAGNGQIFNESEGHSSVHGAYFADLVFDPSVEPAKYRGCGVAYWEVDSNVGAWGPFWVRWAAGQSYAEAVDPSWSAVASWIAAQGQMDPQAFTSAFWREKAIPRWLRYGGATYVERFLADRSGDDPWVYRKFAAAEIEKNGGMVPIDELFAFALTPNDPAKAAQLYQSAGLVVAYLLDGSEGEADLQAAHEAFKSALEAGDSDAAKAAAEKLQEELKKRSDKIAAFASA